jgi:hypothetical protein
MPTQVRTLHLSQGRSKAKSGLCPAETRIKRPLLRTPRCPADYGDLRRLSQIRTPGWSPLGQAALPPFAAGQAAPRSRPRGCSTPSRPAPATTRPAVPVYWAGREHRVLFDAGTSRCRRGRRRGVPGRPKCWAIAHSGHGWQDHPGSALWHSTLIRNSMSNEHISSGGNPVVCSDILGRLPETGGSRGLPTCRRSGVPHRVHSSCGLSARRARRPASWPAEIVWLVCKSPLGHAC